jgi:hypothetical protein
MPSQTYPPYAAGSLTIPRTLNRWLDVNAQSGALRRTQTFVTLPVFSQAVTWRGYSEIVASFNYESPNAFSFVSAGMLPASPNYVLCVSYRVGGVVTRYALWRGAGETFYFNCPLYDGQPILKNFRFEVWSTNSTPAVQTAALTFFTSVLGEKDYRFGVDNALVGSDAISTSFQCANEVVTSPATTTGVAWLDYSKGVGYASPTNVSSWTDQFVNNYVFYSASGLRDTGLGYIYNQGLAFADATIADSINHIFLAVRVVNAATVFRVKNGTSTIGILTHDGNQFIWYTSTGDALAAIALNTWCILEIRMDEGGFDTINLYDTNLNLLNTGTTGTSGALTITGIQLFSSAGRVDFKAIAFYSALLSAVNRDAVLGYLTGLFNNPFTFSVPLTFPVLSLSQTN